MTIGYAIEITTLYGCQKSPVAGGDCIVRAELSDGDGAVYFYLADCQGAV